MTMVLDKGTINSAPLTIGSSAGKALLADQYDTMAWELVYGGQEASGARRHFFEVKSSTSSSTVEFPIFISPGAGGQGVTLEVPLGSKWGDGSLLGKTLYLMFEKPWYSGPASGTEVNASITVESARWLYFRNSEMQVHMTRKIRMP